MLPSTKSNLCSILFLEKVKFQYSKYFEINFIGVAFAAHWKEFPQIIIQACLTIIIIHKKAKLCVPYPSYGKSSIKPATLSNKPPPPPIQGKRVNNPSTLSSKPPPSPHYSSLMIDWVYQS